MFLDDGVSQRNVGKRLLRVTVPFRECPVSWEALTMMATNGGKKFGEGQEGGLIRVVEKQKNT